MKHIKGVGPVDFNWPVLALCGNAKQFENLKREAQVKGILYISGPNSVRGLGRATVICYGTYFWRSDYDEIKLILDNRPEITRIIHGTTGTAQTN